ncbi:MAG: acetyl-CoA carboxylase, carboxyltransferase subunit beta [Alphaproteobacteria bacterium]|nr:acetyl-CoA carboxylase, carboxyltransferase subunit beta [Alphaproteobacteria bacterium]
MNWLTNFIRPRIRSFVEPKEVPDNLWQKCDVCEGMLFHRDLKENLNVCYHCGHHLRITVKERLAILFDGGEYETLKTPDVPFDPLKFRDQKKYSDRLKDTQNKTGLKDAITLAKGTIGGNPVVIAAFNFRFMGGSMGMAVGEGIVRAAEEAVRTKSAFIVVPSSGGARMQEGMLSLVQMPRSIIGVEMVKDAGLPYIVLLTDPTTGGVSASFAMVGDIHLAEPKSMIGFAGRRVIEETVRETLPADFQTAEYLQEHGMVDMVVPRKELHETLTRILNLLMKKRVEQATGDKSKGGNPKANGAHPPLAY